MNKPVDIILLRAEQGVCPICKAELTDNFTTVEYKGQDIKICSKHTKEEKS
jgi:hypothetical protein